MTDDIRPDTDQPETERHESDRPELEGPAADSLAAEEATRAAAADTFEQAIDGLPEPVAHDEVIEDIVKSGPDSKLERLQKILAQSGIASRRHAEELITQGRVQVNGKVVTELGTKADASRDHIRVDGKLLQGSERLRYFMLNKPKGFVTTVSDPEGRPTIMQFFSKMRERLYPVGRLDYLSEGLLLVTNDGELANKLTRAASGVEKTYLVKVSGQPSDEEIDRLRQGVGIDRGKPGAGRVQTAPADIRKVRQGDNPWYEVVLIEGRNRELRKMFEEIGHRVEKIRRVGYGPLVLDLEPGKIRELVREEIENLRKAAEGKYRKPKLRQAGRHSASRDMMRSGSKPHWKQRAGEDREERGQHRRPERPERGLEPGGPVRPPRRGPYASSRPGKFHSKPRFEGRAPQRSPGGVSKNRFADNQSRGYSARPEKGARPPKRFDQEGRPQRSGARTGRFEGIDRQPTGKFRSKSAPADRPRRSGERRTGPPTGFSRNASPPHFKGAQRPRFDRDREQAPEQRSRIDREQHLRLDRGRPEPAKPDNRRKTRQDDSERPQSGLRPGRFNQTGPGEQRRGRGPHLGSMRSGGGRRPGSKPGSKSGRPGKGRG